jgi:uncharacterized repeat protein (TIGR01451 family)
MSDKRDHQRTGIFPVTFLVGVLLALSITLLWARPVHADDPPIEIQIGDLPPGKKVTIIFEATVTDTLPAGVTQVSNHALITGTNIADQFSDDPDTPAVDDATVTHINLDADLGIVKGDGQTEVIPGAEITYTIVVTNAGPSSVSGATVSDSLPAALIGVTWTCQAGPGAACDNPSGTGDINETVDIAVAGYLTYTVNGTVAPGATGSLANTALVAVPAGYVDPAPGNNASVDTDTIRDVDYGDAPDPTYPTLLASDGARHVLGIGPFLGAAVDGDPDGQPNGLAIGDDTDASGDDEDGVVFTSLLVAGETATLDVTASAAGLLNAWIDYNDDGDWADAGEQVFVDRPLAAGLNNLNLAVPATATPTNLTFVRFRFSTVGGLSYTGLTADGEVEDYAVEINGVDHGDAPDPAYPTLRASNGARHILSTGPFLGAVVDADPDGQPTAAADGDDTDPGGDDEDGVTLPSLLVTGETMAISVTASAPGLLNAWIDYNGNDSWADAGEQVFTDEPLAAGVNSLSIVVPPGAAPGQTYARFRLDTVGGLSFDGLAADGEVEDYTVEIRGVDYGDAPDPRFSTTGEYPTLLANDGARHVLGGGLFLGAAVDADADGQPTAAADGDDIDAGGDDEDGVVFTSVLLIGKSASISVTASAAGLLNAWIDFDGDGIWTAGEQVFGDVSLAAGVNNLTFTVPAGATLGQTYARFRVDTVGGLSFDGLAWDGEVEDYGVEIISNQFFVSDVTLTEGDTGTIGFAFVISRTDASTSSSVQVQTANGTASDASDYSSLPLTTLNFAAGGGLTQTVTVQVNGDTLVEADETFYLNLSNPVGGAIADGQGQGTILNDDSATLSIDDVTVDEGAGTATLTVTLSTLSALDTEVSFVTSDGTAVAGSDYAATGGSFTIPAGDLTATISVIITDDVLHENAETFTVTLSAPVHATIADGEGIGTIVDNDAPPEIVSVADVTVGEAAGTATFTVTLSAVSGLDAHVGYATNSGTAQAGLDYTATSGLLTIPAGHLTGTVLVDIADDALDESDETFTVTLSSPVNATLVDSQGIGTIVDDDETPVAVADVYVTAEDTTLSISAAGVLSNDIDLDGDPLTAVLDSGPSNGVLALNLDGSFAYTPTLNYNGLDVFSYYARDSVNESNSVLVTITVHAVNDRPIFTSVPITDAEEAQTYAYGVTANDVDAGDVMTITAPTRPAWLNLVDNGDGTALLSGTPDAADVGPHSVELQVRDAVGETDTQVFTITVRERTVYYVYLPLVARNYAVAPDLVVVDIAPDGTGMTIQNQGDAPATDDFWVDLYVNPTVPPTGVNQTWQSQGGGGIVWGVTYDLAPGETLVLDLGSPYYVPSRSNFGGTIAAGYGAVLENHEIVGGAYNNITGPVYSTTSSSAPPGATGRGRAQSLGNLPERP